MAGRLVQEIALVMSLEGSRTVASEATAGIETVRRANEELAASAGRAKAATQELTEAQRQAAVEAARLEAAEEKTAAAIARARRGEAAAAAQDSRTKSAQLNGNDLTEADSAARRALLADRSDKLNTVVRSRFDKEAGLLDEQGRKAWASIDKAFTAGGSKGAAGWREAIASSVEAHPGALESERLRSIVQRRLDFEGGQERIRGYGADAVERTQKEFTAKADRKKETEAAAKARESEGASDGFLRAVEAEIRANERLEKAVAKVTQETKRKDAAGIAGAELGEKHARKEAEDAAAGTRAAIDRVLKGLSEDEREAFALMEAAVARMTSKGMREMAAWRMAATVAAKGVREELGSAMRGPDLSRLAGALAQKADFAASAAKYREVAESVDMVSRSARRATAECNALSRALGRIRHGFGRALGGVNELAGGIGQFASFSFNVFRNVSFLVRNVSFAFRSLTGVVRGTVRAVSSLVSGVSRLAMGFGRLVVRTGVGFLSGAIHAVERLTGLVRDLVHEVGRATASLVAMAKHAAASALHWGKWAAVGAGGLAALAGREGWKDAGDLGGDVDDLKKTTTDDQDWDGKGLRQDMSESKSAMAVEDRQAHREWKDSHPKEHRGHGGRRGTSGQDDGSDEEEPHWSEMDHGIRFVRGAGSVNKGWDTDVRQVFDGLAAQLKVPTDAMKGAMEGLSKEIRAAASDKGSADAAMFRKLGVSTTERDPFGREQARKVYDVMLDVARALQRGATVPGLSKEQLFTNLFGSADSQAIDPFLKSLGGEDGLRKEEERQKRLGTFLSKQDIADAEDFKRVVGELKDAIKGVRMEIGRELMPYLKEWSKQLTDWLVAHRGQIAGMVTRTVVNARRIGLTLMEKAREVAYGLFVLYERFAAGQTILQRFVAYLDRIDLASRVYRFGFQSWVTYLVLFKREVQEIVRQLHARGVATEPFGLHLPTIGRIVFALMQLEQAATKAGFALYDSLSKKLAEAGGWAKFKADVSAVASNLWGAARAAYVFGNEFFKALGGTAGIASGLQAVEGVVGRLTAAFREFAKAHGLDHGDTWAKMLIDVGTAVVKAYETAKPYLVAFAKNLRILLTGDAWAAQGSPVLSKLVELRGKLIEWSKAMLADLKNVFLNGKDADGIQTWVGTVAQWMVWIVGKLPEWWESIKRGYKEVSDFVSAAWGAMVHMVRGEKTGFAWLDDLVAKVKLVGQWIEKLFDVFKTVHEWMTKFKEATGWDIESGLLFLGIMKMSGILGAAVGGWRLLTGSIQATAGVLQAFIALCRGDLAGVLGVVRSALGLSGVGGAAGIAEGAAGLAGGASAYRGMVGMGPNGQPVAPEVPNSGIGPAALDAAEAGGGGMLANMYKGYRQLDPFQLGKRTLGGLSEGLVWGAATGMAEHAVGVMKQNANEENTHIADMQDLHNVGATQWSKVAAGLVAEIKRVSDIADGNLNDGHGSAGWRRDFNRAWRDQAKPEAKTIANKLDITINGDEAASVDEDGKITKAVMNSKYSLSTATGYQ